MLLLVMLPLVYHIFFSILLIPHQMKNYKQKAQYLLENYQYMYLHFFSKISVIRAIDEFKLSSSDLLLYISNENVISEETKTVPFLSNIFPLVASIVVSLEILVFEVSL